MESMIEDIISTHEQLAKELRFALATMERSNKVEEIHQKIIENQKRCPHFDNNYNWAIVNETCPYCGFHFVGGDR